MALSLLSGCASISQLFGSSPDATPKPAPDLAAPVKSLQDQVGKMNEENRILHENIGRLQAELQSLREDLFTQKRKIEVWGRGNRSGIYESHEPNIGSPFLGKIAKNDANKFKFQKLEKPEQENTDEDEEENDADSAGKSAIDLPKDSDKPLEIPSQIYNEQEANAQGNPEFLLAEAQNLFLRAQYGEAIVTLSTLQKQFPNQRDGGSGLVLLAQCWMKLGQPDNVFPILRNFYAKFPNSPEYLKGKMIEAQAQEKAGARERALIVYKEVIALGPQTRYAQEARSALAHMRDSQ